jgi:hypothetical protein
MLNFLSTIGVILLLHAAYSCLHYRMLLLDVGEDSAERLTQKAPWDVWVEVGLALVLVWMGELTRSGSALYPVSNNTATVAQAPRKTFMAPPYRTRDFDIYTHLQRANKVT